VSEHFVMCARLVKKGEFVAEPGPSQFLLVPDDELPSPKQAVKGLVWFKKLREASVWGKDSRRDGDRGDILVFIHGYNNSQEIVMKRHQQLVKDLKEVGYKGSVMSFDWPSADKTLNYLEDRHDAKQTAMQLVTDGIQVLAREQTPDCTINIHLLGHSTGVYVIREAFDDADDARLSNNSWMTSQVVFIGGDISSASLSQDNSASEALYRHCLRLTNYSNLRDSVLKLSNSKRLGVAPRVGRVGLPDAAPPKAVNVDCTQYFAQLESDSTIRQAHQRAVIGTFDHSWHIGNLWFTQDLFETLKGDLDRAVIPTRQRGGDGKLELAPAA
jgi:esterase/lipase superfamily enzyme